MSYPTLFYMEVSTDRYGSPDSSKVSRSGKGCGLALPSRIQVQRTNASRAIVHFHVQFWFPGSVLAETGGGKSAGATRSFHSIGIHQYFTGFAGFQPLHGFRKVLHRDAVGYYGVQVELACLQQRRHLVPGLVHASSVDALNRDAFENNVVGKLQRDGV